MHNLKLLSFETISCASDVEFQTFFSCTDFNLLKKLKNPNSPITTLHLSDDIFDYTNN